MKQESLNPQNKNDIAHPMGQPQSWVQALLHRELLKRCQANPHYSLRAFARTLGVSPSALSQVFSGKRSFSLEKRKTILAKIELRPDEAKNFLAVQTKTKKHNSQNHQNMQSDQFNTKEGISPSQFELDSFEIFSEWYYFALFCLLSIENESQKPEHLARRLNLHVFQVKEGLERLKRVGLIDYQNAKWVLKTTHFEIQNQTSTPLTRQFNCQLLEKAITSVKLNNFDQRAAAATMFSVDSRSVAQVREEIRNFRRYIQKKYESVGAQSDVYCISAQFFPITQPDLKKRGE